VASSEDGAGLSRRDIARDLADYLQEHPSVCADVSVHAGNHPWVRCVDGEWRRAQFGKYDRIEGSVLDRETVVDLFASNPVRRVPVEDAYVLREDSGTVWEHASEQDVFSDRDRCKWCGYSSRTRDLSLYETVADGDCLLCEDCSDEWERAGELVGEKPTDADDSEVAA